MISINKTAFFILLALAPSLYAAQKQEEQKASTTQEEADQKYYADMHASVQEQWRKFEIWRFQRENPFLEHENRSNEAPKKLDLAEEMEILRIKILNLHKKILGDTQPTSNLFSPINEGNDHDNS